MAGEWEDIPAPSKPAAVSADGWEDVQPQRRAADKRNPGVAGLASLGTSLLGLPVDTVTNVLNMGIAGAGAATGTTPGLIQAPVGSSEWFKQKLRGTAMSADNPNPGSKLDTLAYDLTARGGGIPGGAIPALGSVAAEAIGGPQWAGVGAMAPAAAGAAVRAIPPIGATSPQARMLADEGVQMTPGQLRGGTLKRMEDAATSVPILGDAIRGAQRRSVESFDTAAINRGLEPIGVTLPKGMTGNRAIEYAYGKLGDAYENLLPNLKGDLHAVPGAGGLPAKAGQAANPSLQQELDAIKQMGANLPPAQSGQLNRIIDNEVLKRFTSTGKASGETLKDIESKLGVIGKGMRRSEDYDVRNLGEAVKETQAALRRMVENVNPAYQGELAKINEGYSNFKIAQNAASSVGANEGVFTPAQLHRAVRSQDISKDKARFAEGNANMQDLSAAGRAVLPSSVPDSGTPLRSMLAYAMAHPVRAAGLSIPVGMAALPYSQVGQGILQRILTSQPGQGSGIDPMLSQATLQGILSQQRQ